MKSQIHPKFYTNTTVSCICGANFTTGSVLTDIKVEVCSNCHPVYTGVKRYVDTLGRVDKFLIAQKKASSSISPKKSIKAKATQAPESKSLKEMLEEVKKTV